MSFLAKNVSRRATARRDPVPAANEPALATASVDGDARAWQSCPYRASSTSKPSRKGTRFSHSGFALGVATAYEP